MDSGCVNGDCADIDGEEGSEGDESDMGVLCRDEVEFKNTFSIDESRFSMTFICSTNDSSWSKKMANVHVNTCNCN